MTNRILVLLIITIFIVGCDEAIDNKQTQTTEISNSKAEVKYATGFAIEYFENYKVVELKNPWRGENTTYKYVLYNDKKPSGFDDVTFIKTPIKSIACMSLTHVAFIERLNQINSIKAISGCDYVSDNEVLNRINTNQIKEVGQHGKLDYEMLVDENPDLVMAYGIDASSKKHLNKMSELGLNVVLNGEYMENHPLGQAEWIKYVAAFYNLDEEANKLFEEIEQDYISVKKVVADKVKDKPSVFLSMPWNGVWYMAGGASFQAQLLNDAGVNYLWSDNDEKSNFTIDKEVVLEKAFDADYWINLNSYNSIADIVAYDENFAELNAVKNKSLYNNNKRLNSTMGNDFWESGIVSPNVVLKDLVEIFHPDILEHELYYYKKLD